MTQRLRLAALGLALLWSAGSAQAASWRLCDRSAQASAKQQDQLLRFAAVVKAQLEASGSSLAIVSRSGLDLRRLGIRYSHAGVSLRASPNSPWSVRQLYYACDEGRPRLFDQGMAGYVLGLDNPASGFISILLLPQEAAAALEKTALDNAASLQLLAGTYSANAYAFSLQYQNCNQWLAELIATAWGAQPEAGASEPRARAQHWLAQHGYNPTPVALDSHLLMFAAPFIPHVHLDDHPENDRFALRLRVSLPAAIESFVRERVQGTRRIELCHAGGRVVVRHGWVPLNERCEPLPGDTLVPIDDTADAALSTPIQA